MHQANEHTDRAKVLILDFISLIGESSGLECLLQEILCPASSLNAGLREWDIEVMKGAINLRQVCDQISRCQRNLLFFVLDADTLEIACQRLVELREAYPEIPVIAVTEVMESDGIQTLLDFGASDFILAPFKPVDVVARVRRGLEYACHWQSPVQTLKETLGLEQIIGESLVFRKEIEKIPRLARCDASVLIAGETGTGKELCASAIHYLSPRAGHPFVPVNCGAIPVELMENELFGHDRGAYTGAHTSQTGMISEANGGTLFLDEIDCLPATAQVKLLRFLQKKEYRPLGSSKTNQADVRVIAASNTDLREAIKSGRLRQDLYYRLNVLSLHLPPLRERREDIPVLSRHFLAKYAYEFDKPAKDISPDALRKLKRYDWPGNVRELENLIERAVALSESRSIHGADIDLPQENSPVVTTLPISFQEAKTRYVAQFERDYVQELLRLHQGNITKAAQSAMKDRRAFWELIRKHKIDARSFKPGLPRSNQRQGL
jgi:two-component system, NtrC family, response regulator GlrR